MNRNDVHHSILDNNGPPPIVVNNNDVLSGRGVNIAQHPGNERFRTLVTTRTDESYCTTYSASEKRAIAQEIIQHIANLNPPGKFLKREGTGQVSRGLHGPWRELSEREAIKKTCQALRDCNRTDRVGYATGVVPPEDVVKSAKERAASGLTGKQHAAIALSASGTSSASLKRKVMEGIEPIAITSAAISPISSNISKSVTAPNEIFDVPGKKKQKQNDGTATPVVPFITDSTMLAADSGEIRSEDLGFDPPVCPPPLHISNTVKPINVLSSFDAVVTPTEWQIRQLDIADDGEVEMPEFVTINSDIPESDFPPLSESVDLPVADPVGIFVPRTTKL